jgi:ribose/xylose/arabinose/galactoside ABC-type transport system permease subunit
MRHRRLIAALVVLAAALAVGIAFGYLAGIAVALGAATILLLTLGTSAGIVVDQRIGENLGRGRWGSENDDSRGDR